MDQSSVFEVEGITDPSIGSNLFLTECRHLNNDWCYTGYYYAIDRVPRVPVCRVCVYKNYTLDASIFVCCGLFFMCTKLDANIFLRR